MSIATILNKIIGISDGGRNTAAEFRDVLVDMTDSLSASTEHMGDDTIHFPLSGVTLDSVTSIGNVTTNEVILGALSAQTIQVNNYGGLAGVGRFTWNDEDGTVNLGMAGGNVTLQLGQESYVHARAAEDLPDVSVVYISGVFGTTGKQIVSKFIADNSIDELYTIGVTTEFIGNNSTGFVTTVGVIHDIDTTGPIGENWSDGDVLYASSTVRGALTNILPIAPALNINVGIVLKKNPTNGSIYIRPVLHSHLNEIHDVYINNKLNGDFLSFNGDRWVNIPRVIAVPLSSTSNGLIGQIAFDATYLYSCVANNTWVRTLLTAW
jgi:hypothetical protein